MKETSCEEIVIEGNCQQKKMPSRTVQTPQDSFLVWKNSLKRELSVEKLVPSTALLPCCSVTESQEFASGHSCREFQ